MLRGGEGRVSKWIYLRHAFRQMSQGAESVERGGGKERERKEGERGKREERERKGMVGFCPRKNSRGRPCAYDVMTEARHYTQQHH